MIMEKEDKKAVVWILAVWAVLIICICIWPDIFTRQLFEDERALWITLGAMFAISCFLPAFLRKVRGNK